MIEKFDNPWIDWEVWSRIEVARIYEFAALLADVTPDDVRIAPHNEAFPREWEFGEPLTQREQTTFLRVFQLGLAGLKAGTLKPLRPDSPSHWAGTEVRREDFIRWAKSLNLKIPPRMTNDGEAPGPTDASTAPPLASVTDAMKAAESGISLALGGVSVALTDTLFRSLAERAGKPIPKGVKRGVPNPVARDIVEAVVCQYLKENPKK